MCIAAVAEVRHGCGGRWVMQPLWPALTVTMLAVVVVAVVRLRAIVVVVVVVDRAVQLVAWHRPAVALLSKA